MFFFRGKTIDYFWDFFFFLNFPTFNGHSPQAPSWAKKSSHPARICNAPGFAEPTQSH
jgi:hypothetical protein